MVSLTPAEPMREGMRFRSVTRVCCITNRTTVAVERLIPEQWIELVSKTGLISFRAVYTFVEISSAQTEVICTLRFEFNGFIFNAPRPIIESMAQTRVYRDLTSLCALISGDAKWLQM